MLLMSTLVDNTPWLSALVMWRIWWASEEKQCVFTQTMINELKTKEHFPLALARIIEGDDD